SARRQAVQSPNNAGCTLDVGRVRRRRHRRAHEPCGSEDSPCWKSPKPSVCRNALCITTWPSENEAAISDNVAISTEETTGSNPSILWGAEPQRWVPQLV